MNFIETTRGRWINAGLIQTLMQVDDRYYAIMADGEREWISEADYLKLTGGERGGEKVQRSGNTGGFRKKNK